MAGSAARAVPGDTTKWMPGPAHSFVEVLIGEHGTMLGLYAGEDEIIREIEECPVRPVKWNEGVTGRE